MSTSTDYYVILGVDSQASSEVIKAAFKKLALQYHPDVYKGEDAQERMRQLLQAYRTLSDPVARREYDAQHNKGQGKAESAIPRQRTSADQGSTRTDECYAFPDLSVTPVSFTLGKIAYRLSYEQAEALRWEGVLSGSAPQPVTTASGRLYSCHRCLHQWSAYGGSDVPLTCPACRSGDWAEYLLLHCTRCYAVFESKEIVDPLRGGSRYYPYELFPLCPHCRRSQWCPSENVRVAALRAAAARRSMILWGGTIVVCAVLLVLVALLLLHGNFL